MNEIRWGIIGCGEVTEVKSGPAFNKVANSKLVAVMRRDAIKAKDYAKRHGVKNWYTDVVELINDPDVNAIYIATPPLQHEEYTIMALAAGKPVYVEKPMAINGNASMRMVEAAKTYNTKLCVAHYRRAQPLFLKIKALLAENAIGDVRLIDLKMFQPKNNKVISNATSNWRIHPAISGGGLFHDLAPHQIDLMLYYFGEAKSFSGIATAKDENQADDIVTGHILFNEGIVFNGTWCFAISEGEELDICEIHGTSGKISFPMFGHQITISKDGSSENFDFLPLPHVEQPMIEGVVNYFLGKGENPCSGEEALKTMRILDSFTKK